MPPCSFPLSPCNTWPGKEEWYEEHVELPSVWKKEGGPTAAWRGLKNPRGGRGGIVRWAQLMVGWADGEWGEIDVELMETGG